MKILFVSLVAVALISGCSESKDSIAKQESAAKTKAFHGDRTYCSKSKPCSKS